MAKTLIPDMAKKKLNSLSDLGFVFSTDENTDFSPTEASGDERIDPSDQYLEAHFSNKGRGGKTVTIIKGFEGPETDRKALAKLLKTKCSTGGTVKGGEIIIQGNFRDKIMQILKAEGYNVKRVGG